MPPTHAEDGTPIGVHSTAGLGVLLSKRYKALLATCPIGRPPSLIGHSDVPNFICGNLIEDATGEPAKNIATLAFAEDRAKVRIGQQVGRRPLKLGEKRETELGVCARGIERCGIVQLGKSEWNDD